jgi:hypothetical protein
METVMMIKKIFCRASALTMAGMFAAQASATLVYNQGFEVDTSGWFDFNSAVVRVASGTDGIASAGGAFHGIVSNIDPNQTGIFTRYDGYRDTWPDGFIAKQQIYLDTGWADGTGFDLSVAANGSDGAHQRDFIFHVEKDASTGSLLVGGSNNTNFDTLGNLEASNHYAVVSSGWYTFQHVFSDVLGQLSVDLNLIDAGGTTLFTETRTSAIDLIPTEVGGNRYGWFTFNDIDRLAIDNTMLEINTQATVPTPATLALFSLGLAGLGWSRRKKA